MGGEQQPSVLIVGGFATLPINYWRMRRRLLRRSAQRVDIAPLYTPDWLIGALLGLGPVMRRTGRAIRRTWELGGRQPIIVIGHSGGGIAARLAMANAPFNGRRAGAADAVGCLVTLGTPHGLAALPNRFQHAGHSAASFLDRETPGAFFAPRTAYLTVGSRFAEAVFPGLGGRLAKQVFSIAVGDDTQALGDGIVPFSAVHLEGAEQVTYEDVRHGMIGAPWYGDDAVMDRWWPVTLRLWRSALDARSRGDAGSGPSQAEIPVLA